MISRLAALNESSKCPGKAILVPLVTYVLPLEKTNHSLECKSTRLITLSDFHPFW